MINVNFWSYGKKRNSTAVPSTAPEIYPCNLLDDTSIINPVLTITGDAEKITRYSYAKIDAFDGRYYFVSDITSNGPYWILSLVIDVLASWRYRIGVSTQYVLRAAADKNDLLIDHMYPTECNPVLEVVRPSTSLWAKNVTEGFFVVGINNADTANSIGGVSYYVFNPEEFQGFRKALLGDVNWRGEITEIGADLFKALVDPFSYVVSAIWLPINPGGGVQTGGAIDMGFWRVPLPSGVIYRYASANPVTRKSVTIPLPKHPQASKHPWTMSSPYTQYNLFVEPFGSTPIDASELIDADGLRLEVEVDYMTGAGRLMIYRSVGGEPTADLIGSMHGQVGVTVNLNNLSNDYIGGVNAVLGGAVNAVSGVLSGNLLAPIGEAANIIDGVTQSLSKSSSVGAQGSMLPYSDYVDAVQLVAKFYNITDTDPENLGSPLCKLKQIDTIPGYIKCDGAHVEIPGTETEIDMIKSAMEEGFYFE